MDIDSNTTCDPRMPVELTEPIRSALRHCMLAIQTRWDAEAGVSPQAAVKEAADVLQLMDQHTANYIQQSSASPGEPASQPNQRCPIHGTVLNAAGDCFLCRQRLEKLTR